MSVFLCLGFEGTCEEIGAEYVFDPLSRTSSKEVPGEMVFPALAVAEMGFSWALYLCPAAMVHQLFVSVSRRRNVSEALVRERQPVVAGGLPPRLRRGAPHLASYVDNGSIFGFGRADARFAIESLLLQLEAVRLQYKDVVVAERSYVVVGVFLCGIRLEIRNLAARTWRYYYGIQQACRVGRQSPRNLAVLIGHGTHLFQLTPHFLSFFQEVYPVAADTRGDALQLSSSVLAELRASSSLALLVSHDCARAMSPTVFCSDSSSKGYARHEVEVERGLARVVAS